MAIIQQQIIGYENSTYAVWVHFDDQTLEIERYSWITPAGKWARAQCITPRGQLLSETVTGPGERRLTGQWKFITTEDLDNFWVDFVPL